MCSLKGIFSTFYFVFELQHIKNEECGFPCSQKNVKKNRFLEFYDFFTIVFDWSNVLSFHFILFHKLITTSKCWWIISFTIITRCESNRIEKVGFWEEKKVCKIAPHSNFILSRKAVSKRKHWSKSKFGFSIEQKESGFIKSTINVLIFFTPGSKMTQNQTWLSWFQMEC